MKTTISPFIFCKTLIVIGVVITPFALHAADIHITIKEIENGEGSIMVAVYDKAEAFLGADDYSEKLVKAQAGTVQLTIENVVAGKYAISCYHDEDDDGKMDSNLMRIPTEGHCFSNDAKASFGPPKFDGAAFIVEDQDITLEITMRY